MEYLCLQDMFTIHVCFFFSSKCIPWQFYREERVRSLRSLAHSLALLQTTVLQETSLSSGAAGGERSAFPEKEGGESEHVEH